MSISDKAFGCVLGLFRANTEISVKLRKFALRNGFRSRYGKQFRKSTDIFLQCYLPAYFRCTARPRNRFAVLSQGEPRNSTLNVDTYRMWVQSQHKTRWITFGGHSRSRILKSLKSTRSRDCAYYSAIMSAIKTEISTDRSEHFRFYAASA